MCIRGYTRAAEGARGSRRGCVHTGSAWVHPVHCAVSPGAGVGGAGFRAGEDSEPFGHGGGRVRAAALANGGGWRRHTRHAVRHAWKGEPCDARRCAAGGAADSSGPAAGWHTAHVRLRISCRPRGHGRRRGRPGGYAATGGRAGASRLRRARPLHARRHSPPPRSANPAARGYSRAPPRRCRPRCPTPRRSSRALAAHGRSQLERGRGGAALGMRERRRKAAAGDASTKRPATWSGNQVQAHPPPPLASRRQAAQAQQEQVERRVREEIRDLLVAKEKAMMEVASL